MSLVQKFDECINKFILIRKQVYFALVEYIFQFNQIIYNNKALNLL